MPIPRTEHRGNQDNKLGKGRNRIKWLALALLALMLLTIASAQEFTGTATGFGGPVTITHRDIIRYFMTIPEACSLVLEAGCMGDGGEIYIFDYCGSIFEH